MRVAITISVILLIWLAYTVWPFVELYRLANAVEARDVAAGESPSRFPGASGIPYDTNPNGTSSMTGKTGVPGSLLEQFTAGVGASIADPLVAKII